MRRRTFLAAVAAGSAASVAGCQDGGERSTLETFDATASIDPSLEAGDDWPMANGDAANTRSVAADVVPEPPLSVEWTAPFETHVGFAHPTVGEGVVVATDLHGEVFALDVATGDRRWTARLSPFDSHSGSSAMIDGETVHFLPATGRTVGLKTDSGEERWSRYRDEHSVRASGHPVFHDGLGVAMTAVGLEAFETDSGERRWQTSVGLRIGSTPAITETAVYAGGDDATLHALDLETGDVLWRAKADDRIRAGPAVVDGTAYVGTRSGTVYAVDETDGEERWRTEFGSAVRSIAVGNGIVCVATEDALVALEPTTGSRVWRRRGDDSSYARSPVVGGGLVFALVNPDDGHPRTVSVFDAETGELAWTFEDESRSFAEGPVVVDGSLYLIDRWGDGSGGEREIVCLR